MEEKVCSKCGVAKPLTEFAQKSKTRLSPACKNCHREYSKAHYSRNKESYKKKGGISRDKLTARNYELMKLAKDKPCTDCKIKYPHYVMEFDHLRDKKFNISHGRALNTNRVLLEINKCEVVCANCHRQRTHIRRCGEIGSTRKT